MATYDLGRDINIQELFYNLDDVRSYVMKMTHYHRMDNEDAVAFMQNIEERFAEIGKLYAPDIRCVYESGYSKKVRHIITNAAHLRDQFALYIKKVIEDLPADLQGEAHLINEFDEDDDEMWNQLGVERMVLALDAIKKGFSEVPWAKHLLS
jgi:hypothetical protein